jgi:hypothetical protein
MRASWTGEAGYEAGGEAGVTQRIRAVQDGGYSVAEREADALLESLDEVLRLLDEVSLESLVEPHGTER